MPPIRIERTTHGLGMAQVIMLEGSVFQMVSPFILIRQGVPAFLLIRLILNNSVWFAEF